MSAQNSVKDDDTSMDTRYTVLCKSNESEMREFRSLSSRTFVEISLKNSSVFSRCSVRYFAKTKSENSQHFRDHSENSTPEA